MKFSVLGCGRWGSFIAWYLNSIGHEVCVWGREGSKNLEALKEGKISGRVFPKSIRLTSDLSFAAAFSDVTAISINSQELLPFLWQREMDAAVQKPLLLCMKGLSEEDGRRLSELALERAEEENIAVWLGPGHVENFLDGIPNCMVIDSYSEELKSFLISALKGPLIRFYYGTDMIGNEVGAATKNVIGIAAGMLDGLNRGSLKGALMSRGAREVSRLIEKMGGNPVSAYGLAHLGDYEATVFSRFSRNRAFGESFVTGAPFTESGLAEGVGAAKAMKVLSAKYQVELPISLAVYDMIYEKKSPEEAAAELFMRDLKKEF